MKSLPSAEVRAELTSVFLRTIMLLVTLSCV